MDEHAVDILVIGGGIAGASVAAELADRQDVVIAEMETQCGYHSTGRSAAVLAPLYGPAPIRALTRAAKGFLENPPPELAGHPLITQRSVLFIARADQMDALQAMRAEVGAASIEDLDAAQVRKTQPLLRQGYAVAGILDEANWDIDVNAMHQWYLRAFKARGGRIMTNAPVSRLVREGGLWRAQVGRDEVTASVVVNAAGAWAGDIGLMAGAENIGLVPKRRTALVIKPDHDKFHDSQPLTVDIDEEFYLKPDAGNLLISPANENPETPCDVQPDILDTALCVDRIERAFDLKIGRIENRWAGLRSFVADKCPVVGFSREVDGFFWLAGQGGYGIQTAPALAELAGAMIRGQDVPGLIQDQGFELASVLPNRLSAAVQAR